MIESYNWSTSWLIGLDCLGGGRFGLKMFNRDILNWNFNKSHICFSNCACHSFLCLKMRGIYVMKKFSTQIPESISRSLRSLGRYSVAHVLNTNYLKWV